MHKVRATTLAALMAGAMVTAGAVSPVRAGVPTVDSAAIAEAAKTAANSAEQVRKLTAVVSSAQKMVSSLGSQGPGAFFMGSSSYAAMSGGGGAADTSMLAQLPHNLCAVRGCPSGSANAEKYAQGEIASVAEGVSFANQSFYSVERLRGADRRDIMTARQNAVREAAISGYAIALATRSALANAQSDTESLESVINEAGTLREDVQANSAALISLHKQMAQMQGLMATMLEIQAAGAIANDSETMKPGGASADALPETYKVSDYASAGGPRQRITNAEVMRGPSSSYTLAGGSSGGASGSAFSDILGSITGDSTVQRAAETAGLSSGDAMGAMLDVASTVARETGNYDVANGLSSMRSAARSGNPQEILWSGAETIASTSGDYNIRNVLRTAKSAARSGNPADVTRMIGVARSAVSDSGSREALQYLDNLARDFRTGNVNAKDAVVNAASTVAQIKGDSELNDYIVSGSDVVDSVERNMTPQQRKELFNIATDAVEKSGSRTQNDRLRGVAESSREAGDQLDWDNPDTPQDESQDTGQTQSSKN